MNDIRVALVGIGGYGSGYVDAVLDHAGELGARLVGAIDPAPRECRRLAEIESQVPRVHASLDEFYEESHADLVVISAPIHLHAPLSIVAVERGSHVLCEKPAAAVIQDVKAMGEAARRTGKSIAIGFQWSYSRTVQAIRRDIASGRLGDPIELKTLTFWPRAASYYARTAWAGRIRTESGSWVLDSPVNNATAHYLHNAHYVLGDGGRPTSVQAELYRANDIESFDSAALRVQTESGAQILFYTAHAVPSRVGPVIHYRFSDADLSCNVPGPFRARFADGSIVDYGDADTTHLGKLRRVVDDLREGRPALCSPEDAEPQVRVACAAHESSGIAGFPPSLVHTTPATAGSWTRAGDPLTWVDGLQGIFTQAFAESVLPSELGLVDWTVAGERIDVDRYDRYPLTPNS